MILFIKELNCDENTKLFNSLEQHPCTNHPHFINRVLELSEHLEDDPKEFLARFMDVQCITDSYLQLYEELPILLQVFEEWERQENK
jgi:hypothetical protein